jgi:hypothetical protein
VFPRCDNHQQQLFATWTGDAPPRSLIRLTLAITWPPKDWKINGDHQGAAQVNGIVG